MAGKRLYAAVWALGVVLAGGWDAWAAEAAETAAPTTAQAPASLWDLRLRLGYTYLNDTAKAADSLGRTESNVQLVPVGVDAVVHPYKGLIADLGFGYGVKDLDTPQSTPARTTVAHSRLWVGAGWQFALSDLGVLEAVDASLAYARERFASERQQPSQFTPAWAHDELQLRAAAHLYFLDHALLAQAGLSFVPVVGVSEDFATNGSSASGLGLDVRVGADYDLGPVLGRGGNLLVGGSFVYAGRWIDFDGRGTRLGVSPGPTVPGNPVSGVSATLTRIEVLAVLTWRWPGAGGGLDSGADGEDESEDAERVGSEIRIKQNIRFRIGSAEIDMVQSHRALRAVGRFLKKHPDLAHIAVRGHTDGQGTPEANLALSQKRAEAVVKALVELGVDAARLTAKGIGDQEPLGSNDTEAGRAANRRVEFKIVE